MFGLLWIVEVKGRINKKYLRVTGLCHFIREMFFLTSGKHLLKNLKLFQIVLSPCELKRK